MPKQIKMIGKLGAGINARLGKEVTYFHAKGVSVIDITPESVTLMRPHKSYTLKKHKSLNIYCGECNGIKVHFTKKKLVATLIYWD